MPAMDAGHLKGDVDFGILTIREDEFRAVLKRFPDNFGDGRAHGRRSYNMRRLDLGGGDAYTIAIIRCVEQGNGEALAATRDLLEDLAPQWVLVVGIAGGVPAPEFTLGDVVVSTRIVDFSVEALLKDGSYEHAVTGGPLHPDAADLAINLPALEAALGPWNVSESIGMERPSVDLSPGHFYGDDNWQKKVRDAITAHFRDPPRAPIFTDGVIASSDKLVKDADRLQVWLKLARQVRAVEMESGGVHRATYGRDVAFLAIRGISDIVGFNREPAWTEYACNTAAAFTRALLLARPIGSRQTFRAFLESLKNPASSASVNAAVAVVERMNANRLRDNYIGAVLLGALVTALGFLLFRAWNGPPDTSYAPVHHAVITQAVPPSSAVAPAPLPSAVVPSLGSALKPREPPDHTGK
jgi:nucleoside phosphorylase